MAVDVQSVVVVTQAALPALLEHRGCVVNVASLAGLGGDAKMTIYNAAKGAVVNLTRSLAVELAPGCASTPWHRAWPPPMLPVIQAVPDHRDSVPQVPSWQEDNSSQ